MNPELASFIDSFKTEEQLRGAIEGLLGRMPNTSMVRNLHGAQELGKDLVFYGQAGLGELQLYACVIKNTKITGSASDPASGARNILIQAEQALDTPAPNPGGELERVFHVYVMSPHDCSVTTINSVVGKLAHRSGQITFWCGALLLSLFKKHWPEYIVFQPGLLAAYVSALRDRIEKDPTLERLALVQGLSFTNKAFSSVYVTPSFYQQVGTLSVGIKAPRAGSLHHHYTRDEMLSLCGRFQQIAQVLGEPDLWPSEEDIGFLPMHASALEKLSSNLRSQWESARQLADKNASDGNQPKSLRVGLPPEYVENILRTAEYMKAVQLEQNLSSMVDKANRTKFNADPYGVIGTENYRVYSAALQAASTVPTALKFIASEPSKFEISEDLLDRFSGHLFITGPPGFGKTSFCRNNVLKDIERFTTEKSNLLPIYIQLHELSAADLTSFETLFLQPEMKALLKSQPDVHVRFYLDGLDEVSSKEKQEAIIRLLQSGMSESYLQRVQCVITAREHIGGRWMHWLPRIRLSPLSDSQLRQLVGNWLEHDSSEIEQFFKTASRLPAIFQILRVPLLGTLTILVYKNLKDLPENKNRLYAMFIDLLLGGWNLAKGIKRHSQFSSTSKLTALTRLAGMLQLSKAKECGRNMLQSSLKQAVPTLKDKAEPVLVELVEDGLLIPTGRDSYVFPHLSFQEYLAARDVDPTGSAANRILRAFLDGEEWWREVISFLIGMSSNPPRLEAWVLGVSQQAKENARAPIPEIEARTSQVLERIIEAFPDYQLTLRRTSKTPSD